jgi:hypothetical protein
MKLYATFLLCYAMLLLLPYGITSATVTNTISTCYGISTTGIRALLVLVRYFYYYRYMSSNQYCCSTKAMH